MKNVLFAFLTLCCFSCSDSPQQPISSKEETTNYAAVVVSSKELFEKGDVNAAKAMLDSVLKAAPNMESEPAIRSLTVKIDSVYNIRSKEKAKKLMSKMRKKVDDIRGFNFYTDAASPKFDNYSGFYAYICEDVKTGSVSLYLKIQYSGDDWLFIEKYIVKSDEYIFDIIPTEEIIRDNNSGGIWEVYNQAVDGSTYGDLLEVIKAKNTKIRFEGRQYYRERKITAAEVQALSRVIDLYAAMGGKMAKF
jgi:hypothetical protein